MMIKRFNEYINESIRDKMTPKVLDENELKVFNFIQEMEEKEEEDYTGEDITKIYNFIKEIKGEEDKDLLNILIDSGYITPSKILFLIKTSLYNSNKQDPWHYYEDKLEEVDEDNITDLYCSSKKTQKSLASVMNLTKNNSNLVIKYIV